MPRNMSFALTTNQIRNRTKTVTRRLGWANLKPGELFWAVEKAQGLKPGEKIKRLALLRCESNRPVRLCDMTPAECDREGFPKLKAIEFVLMFAENMECEPDRVVNRIEFSYADPE